MKFNITAVLAKAALLGAVISTPALAETTTKRTEVSQRTTVVSVSLNQETVLCSRADYTDSFLKILIPQLADLTVLDHRNFGAGAPCVASGVCDEVNNPQNLLKDNRPEEIVPITVTLTKVASSDSVTGICRVSLEEHVEIPVRGKIFLHRRYASIGERTAEDCK